MSDQTPDGAPVSPRNKGAAPERWMVVLVLVIGAALVGGLLLMATLGG